MLFFSVFVFTIFYVYSVLNYIMQYMLAALAQMVAYLPLVQQVRGSISGEVVFLTSGLGGVEMYTF